MICPTCKNDKVLVFPFHLRYFFEHGKLASIPCPDCKGTGEVDDRYPQWKIIGDALKSKRIDQRETLRDFCKRTGADPVLRSRQERGFAE